MAQPQNMEVFESYFQRADMDRDGKISGNEAVVFFQASYLPKQVLARVWSAVDNGSGFLGRSEFYNALRLVTVAQSGRELTPDIVKSALFGPAVAKIPAPKINLASLPAASVSSQVPLGSQGAAMGQQYSSQSIGIRGPTPPLSISGSQQVIRPPVAQVIPGAPSPAPGLSPLVSADAGGTHGFQPSSNSNISNLSLGSKPGVTVSNSTMHGPTRAPPPQSAPQPALFDGFGLLTSQASSPAIPKPQNSSDVSVGVTTNDIKAGSIPANNISSIPSFGGDIFSAAVPLNDPALKRTSRSTPGTSGLQPANFMQGGAATVPTSGTYQQQTMPQVKPIQGSVGQPTSGLASPIVPVGPTSSASAQPWPRLNSVSIQKYQKVFFDVDSDKDGKITGEQARKLFLSWKLPTEVLKQVWDLSDQDADSMLSLREFCIALFLIERSREGRVLPNVLPDSVKMDPMLPPATHPAAYGGTNWGHNPGFPQTGTSLARPPLAPQPVKPSAPASSPPVPDGAGHPVQQKSKVPALEKFLLNQLSAEEQAALNSKLQDAVEADKKVGDLEKEIFEARQKIDYYRTKMQELILYKSRCDNRINEVSQRASADKLEMESLSRKYEEKYKNTGDVASKLSIEEATFRDIQERKMGLYNAIVKMEQGGNADGVLQQRAGQIQSDLEELVKALTTRCKKYGLVSKATLLVELPSGWQPTIPEGAVDWDDDWDKFVDEGFTTIKDVNAGINTRSRGAWSDTASIDGKSDQPSSHFEQVSEAQSAYAQSDDGRSPRVRSPPESLLSERVVDSPTQEHNNKDINSVASPRTTDIFSDQGTAPAIFSSDKFSEDQWRFDDTDSAWGFGSKEPDFDQSSERSFFSSGTLGLNPIRTTDSPRSESRFQKQSSIFADSVPGTPLFNYNSPRFNNPSEDHSFDTFSRFDSFSMNDSGLFPTGGTFARFDSVRSSGDSTRFTSFDDSDPFGSMGPFKSDNQTPKHSDPFVSSDPFKSGDGQTSGRDSGGWSAF